MSNQNYVVLSGNLGADPEHHKKSEDSAGVVSLSVAEGISKLNEKTQKYDQVHTNWFPIKAFGGLAARVKHALKKGDRVTIFGKLRTYRYENSDGNTVSAFEILADEICKTDLLPKPVETYGGAAGN